MDKYEYKVRADEIKFLISQGEYDEAVKIADTIDWRRVKSVMMLCTISDLYKVNRRYEDSRDILLLAYGRHTGGRLIVYSLCELSLKLGEYVQALEYYKEFVQLAPKDSGRYILQYKLYEAQEVSLEERIEVLEELKKRDYRERWAYELAYLYHRVGLASKCVEECDEMFLWFGEGRYVLKALELKMLHSPLTEAQQAKYEQMKQTGGFIQPEYVAEQQEVQKEAVAETEEEEDNEFSFQENDAVGDTKEMPSREDMDIQVKTVDVSQYNTMNLQKELAESMKEFLEQNKAQNISENEAQIRQQAEPRTESPASVQEDLQSAPENEKKEVQAAPASHLINTGVIKTFVKPSGYDNMLSQEYDGQISLVVPEQEKVEKQITGQISIQDIMSEWEKMKQENERRRMEEIRQRVRKQTDTLFADFDESTKSGLLENLERAMVNAAVKEEKQRAAAGRPRVIKTADISRDVSGEVSPAEVQEVPAAVEENLPEKPVNEEEEVLSEDLPAEPEETLSEELPAEPEETFSEELPVEPEEALSEELPVEPEEALSEDLPAEPEEDGDTANTAFQETEDNSAKDNRYSVREMTDSEREHFAPFIHHKKTRRQIVEAIDNISMASFTGNVVITGEEGTGTTTLAKLLIKEIQLSDSNFSGKVAKIYGAILNKKDVSATLSRLSGGALIIENAADMKKVAVSQLLKGLNQEERGLIVLLTDTRANLDSLLSKYPDMKMTFNLRIDVEALDDQTLVKYAKKYALEQEYVIDELGILALHTRIADMQTSDHEVTLSEIEELVDEAIYYANKKTPKHFLDILVGKRYDEEDMIILREKDFMHN